MQGIDVAGNMALYSPEVESCVLGGIVKQIAAGNGSIVHAVSEDDFWLGSNRIVFNAIKSLYSKKAPIDLITLNSEISALYPKSTGEDIVSACDAVMNGMLYTNLDQYIDLLKQASMRRKIISIAETMTKSAIDMTEDMTVLCENVVAQMRGLSTSSSVWASMSDVMVSTFDDIEMRQKGEITGIETGVRDIDRAIGGFFPGEFAVIGARPSVGKSAFGMQIAVDAAKQGKHVCFVSCEMIDSQFGQRLISSATLIDGMKLRNAKIDENEWEVIVDAMQRYAGLPISFTFGTKTIEDIKADIQRKTDMAECDIVIVDYLQLLKTKRKFELEYERVAYISHMLKQMSTEFKIPVIALAQVKRQNNNGRSRCPVLDDLRSSGDIEQDADTVIFLHRPDDADDVAVDRRDKPYYTEIANSGMQYIVFSVAKQRQGQTGIIGAIFDPAHMKYMSIDRS